MAPKAVAPDTLVIRALASHADFDACVRLQRATWGDDFRELVPPAMLQIAQKLGGIAAGAFAGDRLVGFVYGLTGLLDGRTAHWSHMLAVDPACRDQGIGQRLKAHQRDAIRALGIDRIFWTFDPLVARNAYVNLTCLGARVTEYVRDMYGDNPRSRTDSVIGSDRFVVVWDVIGGRDGHDRTPVAPAASAVSVTTADPATPAVADPFPESPLVTIAIPDDIQALKQTAPNTARAWRAATRGAFEHYVGSGYRVGGFARDPRGAGGRYVLERADA
ncbi:MAG: GNAT family N-acetyltransferase [Gemmatimonadota bacterium]|nr:GNAT family N-acetyltransferase [Gemmatimonadota bacterium]